MLSHKDPREMIIKAGNLLANLMGVKAGQTSFSISRTGSLSNYDVCKTLEQVSELLETDPSMSASVILLREVYERYLSDVSVSMKEIVKHARRGDLLLRFSKLARLDELVTEGPLDTIYQRITERSKKVLDHYERDTEKCDILTDTEVLSDVFVDAATSMEQLRVRQYHRGADDTTPPAIVEAIVEFKSMEEVARYAGSIGRNFIMVGYIPDLVNELWSYFFFLVKRGENIYTFSDAVDFIHPTQKQNFNSRRGGIRAFESEKPKCYRFFPYELIDKFVERETEGAYTPNKDMKSLTQTNKESRVKARFAQVRSSSLVWMNLVADRLHTKLFKGALYDVGDITGFTTAVTPALPEVSTELVQSSGGSVVPWDAMHIDMTEFTPQEISFEATAGVYENERRGINWRLEKRYMPLVAKETMLPTDKYFRSPSLATRETDTNAWKKDLVPYTEDHCVGTKVELYRARTQVARLNAVAAVKDMVNKEYAAEVNAAVDAVTALINKRSALMFDFMVHHREEETLTRRLSTYFDDGESFNQSFSHNDNFFIYQYLEGRKNWWDCTGSTSLRNGSPAKLELSTYSASELWVSDFRCPWGHTAATSHYFVMLNCIEDLELLGYEISGLPEIVQDLWHHTDGRYVGNSILSNMDPMDNDLFRNMNLWNALKIRVGFHCSAAAQRKIESGKIVGFPCKFKPVIDDKYHPENKYGVANMIRRF